MSWPEHHGWLITNGESTLPQSPYQLVSFQDTGTDSLEEISQEPPELLNDDFDEL